MWQYNQLNELCHRGILGMHWGKRKIRSTIETSKAHHMVNKINKLEVQKLDFGNHPYAKEQQAIQSKKLDLYVDKLLKKNDVTTYKWSNGGDDIMPQADYNRSKAFVDKLLNQ